MLVQSFLCFDFLAQKLKSLGSEFRVRRLRDFIFGFQFRDRKSDGWLQASNLFFESDSPHLEANRQRQPGDHIVRAHETIGGAYLDGSELHVANSKSFFVFRPCANAADTDIYTVVFLWHSAAVELQGPKLAVMHK